MAATERTYEVSPQVQSGEGPIVLAARSTRKWVLITNNGNGGVNNGSIIYLNFDNPVLAGSGLPLEFHDSIFLDDFHGYIQAVGTVAVCDVLIVECYLQ